MMPRLAQAPWWLILEAPPTLHQDMSTLICFMICLAPCLLST